MDKYISYRETDEEDFLQYYILQKEFPHILVNISERPVVNFVQPVPINEYNLFLVFSGTLRGNVIPSFINIGEEIKSVMQDMSVWFYEYRIIPNEKKYKKWKIN